MDFQDKIQGPANAGHLHSQVWEWKLKAGSDYDSDIFVYCCLMPLSSCAVTPHLCVNTVCTRINYINIVVSLHLCVFPLPQASGDTGVKLQYTHCRLLSLEQRCGVVPRPKVSTAPLVEPQALALVTEIARFDEVLVEAYHELEACVLVAYLFRLW